MNRLARRIRMGSVAGGGGGGAPALVTAYASPDSAYGANRTFTLPGAVSSGSLLVVIVRANAAISGLTDNLGNTYTKDSTDVSGIRQIWSCPNITNGPTQINLTNASDIVGIRTFEISGAATTSPLSVAGNDTGTPNGSPASSLSRTHTTLTANEIIVGFGYGAFTLSSVTPSGMTVVPAVGTAGGAATSPSCFLYLAGAAGAVAITLTFTATQNNTGIVTSSYKSA